MPERAKRRQHDRYELIGCSIHGHELIGTDAAKLRPQDDVFAQESSGTRWYRCLRCDTWRALPPPTTPTEDFPPERDQISVPLRGRALRDRYIQRLIALDRTVRVLLLAPIAIAIFLFAQNRAELHREYARVLSGLQTGFGNPINDFATSELNKIFAFSTAKLYLAGALLAVYAALLACKGVGLWFGEEVGRVSDLRGDRGLCSIRDL